MTWVQFIPTELADLYEIYDFKHAAAILSTEYPQEFQELCHVLGTFRFSIDDIITSGGNESKIPKRFSE